MSSERDPLKPGLLAVKPELSVILGDTCGPGKGRSERCLTGLLVGSHRSTEPREVQSVEST